MSTNASELLDTEGPAAPPRLNGELVFQAPWESRLFGMTLSLHEAGLFEWDEFRQLLIDEIARWERAGSAAGPAAGPWSYYGRWARAFERLLADKGVCAPAEVEARHIAFAGREAGHDHHYDHDH